MAGPALQRGRQLLDLEQRRGSLKYSCLPAGSTRVPALLPPPSSSKPVLFPMHARSSVLGLFLTPAMSALWASGMGLPVATLCHNQNPYHLLWEIDGQPLILLKFRRPHRTRTAKKSSGAYALLGPVLGDFSL